jgi:hypothetical protein
MEATCSSKTSADFKQTTQHYIPDYKTLQMKTSSILGPHGGDYAEYNIVGCSALYLGESSMFQRITKPSPHGFLFGLCFHPEDAGNRFL